MQGSRYFEETSRLLGLEDVRKRHEKEFHNCRNKYLYSMVVGRSITDRAGQLKQEESRTTGGDRTRTESNTKECGWTRMSSAEGQNTKRVRDKDTSMVCQTFASSFGLRILIGDASSTHQPCWRSRVAPLRAPPKCSEHSHPT